jgi:probable HAF family extracellular repeat protein
MVKKIGKWTFLAAIAVVLIAQPVFAQHLMIDLGTLGGTTQIKPGMLTLLIKINNLGQVAGALTNVSGQWRAFLWTAEGGMVDLGTLGNGTHSEAWAINDSGQLVGLSTTQPGDPFEDFTLWDTVHAFFWSAGEGMIDLGTFGGTYSYAYAINSQGQVVGDAETASGEDHAFLWSAAGGMIDLGSLGGFFSIPQAINNAGQVVGYSKTTSGEYHAFLWTAEGGMIDLGTFGGWWSIPEGINNQGQVVGLSTTQPGDPWQDVTLWDTVHAFLWTAEGGMIDLGTLGGTWSRASAINNLGQIVGLSTTASGELHAVLWELALPALSSFSIFATNSVRLSHGAHVNSGNIGVQDKCSGPWCAAKAEVMIGNRAYLKDKVTIYGDSVMIFPGASVYDVYYNELRNKGNIRGDKYTPLELPLGVALPEFPTPHPGTKDYVVPKGKALILESGSYGKIEVELKATLVLTGGTYHVEDLVVGSIQSKVLFRGPTELIIKNYLRSGVNAFIGPEKGADISAKDIRIYVKGIHGKTGKCDANHQAAVIGEHNTVTANIYVPDGTLRIEQDSAVKGAFIAKDVEIGEDAQVTLDSAF